MIIMMINIKGDQRCQLISLENLGVAKLDVRTGILGSRSPARFVLPGSTSLSLDLIRCSELAQVRLRTFGVGWVYFYIPTVLREFCNVRKHHEIKRENK